MIQVNLAKRKASGIASGGGMEQQLGKLGGLGKMKFDLGDIGGQLERAQELPLKRIVAVVCVAIISQVVLSNYEQEELSRIDASITKYRADEVKLKADLEKTKGFEQIKKSLDGDEVTIKTKIEVIQKLILDRQKPPKLMLALSSLMPADVWLQDFTLTSDELKLNGRALGLIQVSDFIKGLGESADFSEPKLVSTDSAKDDAGGDITTFQIIARRR